MRIEEILPEGLTRRHIENAVARGDHHMIYRGSMINIDEIWKMIQEGEKPKEDKQKDDNRGKLKRIQEQSPEGK